MRGSPPSARRRVALLAWEARGARAQLPRRQADACRHPPGDTATAAAVAPPVARRRPRHRRRSLGRLGTATTAIGVAVPFLVRAPALLPAPTITPALLPVLVRAPALVLVLVRAPALVLVLGAGLGERL